jgi:predicted nucleic acid-binding protein
MQGRAIDINRRSWLGHPNHHFWKDEIPFTRAVAPFEARLLGHQQITDAYLLGLAIHKRGALATFDAAIAALIDPESQADPLEIIAM